MFRLSFPFNFGTLKGGLAPLSARTEHWTVDGGFPAEDIKQHLDIQYLTAATGATNIYPRVQQTNTKLMIHKLLFRYQKQYNTNVS
jgi:hypothetical protein